MMDEGAVAGQDAESLKGVGLGVGLELVDELLDLERRDLVERTIAKHGEDVPPQGAAEVARSFWL